MWNLEYELALILISAAIIGWFMGRFVCKSNEYKEHSNNKALKKENQRLESILVEKDSEIHTISGKVFTKNDQIKELEHENNTANTMLETLSHKHEDALGQLQALKPFQPQFEQLSEDYDKQLQQNKQFKIALKKHQEDLNTSQSLSKEQAAQLSEHAKKISGLEQENLTLQNKLTDTHGEYGTHKDKYAELTESYKQLLDESKANKEILEAFTQEKINLKGRIAQLAEENGDLVSRLRAISSVVGAVGTETEQQ